MNCPFCNLNPFHYVHNGMGYEAVAVNCCDAGCDLFSRHAPTARKARQILRLRRSHSPRRKARAARMMETLYGE